MPSSEGRLAEVEEMLTPLGDVTHRKMMGEYLLYLDGVLFGGIYDDRFMLKITPFLDEAIPDAPREPPYPGAKDMVVADGIDAELLWEIVPAVCSQLSRNHGKRNRDSNSL